MDKAERARLKQLANDSIIATFGQESPEARLAVALEKCVDELNDANDKCQTCSVCENHGDHVDESLDVDVGEVLRIHGRLKDSLKAMKEYHVKLSGEIADDFPDTELAEDLAQLIEEVEDAIDELQAEASGG